MSGVNENRHGYRLVPDDDAEDQCFGCLVGDLLSLLDQIDITGDPTLAMGRLDIMRKHGYTVEFGEYVSGALN